MIHIRKGSVVQINFSKFLTAVLICAILLNTFNINAFAGYGNLRVQAVNQVFGVIRKDVEKLTSEIDKSADTVYMIDESRAIMFASQLIAYSELHSIPFTEILETISEVGVVTYNVVDVGYINGSSKNTVTFKPISDYGYTELSMRQFNNNVNTVYEEMHSVYAARELIASTQEALKQEAIKQNSRLRSPIQWDNWRDLLTSHYGIRDITEINNALGGDMLSTYHTGLDFGVGEGTDVYPIAKGTVIALSDTEGGLGVSVTVSHGEYVSVYGHLSEFKVKLGEVVTPKAPIASSGDTGWSTGPHLHLEIYKNGKLMDPYPLINN